MSGSAVVLTTPCRAGPWTELSATPCSTSSMRGSERTRTRASERGTFGGAQSHFAGSNVMNRRLLPSGFTIIVKKNGPDAS
eukprot:3512808-Rhodomonas_salina.1